MHRSSSVLRILHASTLIVPAVVAATSLDQVINAALPSVASDICGRIVNANLYSGEQRTLIALLLLHNRERERGKRMC
jgi:hypothetical protein